MAEMAKIPDEPVRDASITDQQADMLAAKLDEKGYPRDDGYGRTLSLGFRLAMAAGLAPRYDTPAPPVRPGTPETEAYYSGFEKGYQAGHDDWALPLEESERPEVSNG